MTPNYEAELPRITPDAELWFLTPPTSTPMALEELLLEQFLESFGNLCPSDNPHACQESAVTWALILPAREP